tara:strand:+ start:1412 stop:1906 length:495 start_codon:yes stop_codon:yes gene_type:complete
VYGGGSVGIMNVIAESVLNSGGDVIGVIPQSLMDREVGHDGLTELHVTSNMHERKSTMANLSDAFIALPGGLGTLEELFEVLTWSQLGFHRKPIGLLNTAGFYDSLLTFLEETVKAGFIKHEHLALLTVAQEPEELIEAIKTARPTEVDKLGHTHQTSPADTLT